MYLVFERGHYFEEVFDYAIIGEAEDGCFGVFVDGYYEV
jgi:hypothetical protein